MQFKGQYFIFDGIRSRDKNISIVKIDNDNNKGNFGVDRQVETINSVNNTSIIKSIKEEIPKIKITLMKLQNGTNRPLPYAKGELDMLCRWLIHDDFRPFISSEDNGVVAYVIFTKGENYKTCANEGYLELEMQLAAPYAYSNRQISYINVKGEKDITIENKSNIKKYIYPDIEFELMNNNTSIEIINKSLGKTMKLENLNLNEHVYCYNDGLKDFKSMTDPNRNIYPFFNKEWLKLQYGKNKITIKGDCKIKIINQFPIALT